MSGGSGRSAVKEHACAEGLTAERYILGDLSAAERDRFEDHFFECTDCAEAVRCLSLLREGTRAGLCAAPELRARERWLKSGWRQRFSDWWWNPQAIIVLAAVALAAATTWQNVQLQARLKPQVLRSVTLQPASRGQTASLHSAAASGFILLEADLPGASGILTWTVRSSDGKHTAAGHASAPDPGMSWKILLPTGDLPPSTYTLAVRSDSGREWTFTFHAAAN